MSASVLDPPNAWLLTDEVIGAVVQRSKKRPSHVASSRASMSILRSASPELQSPERQQPHHAPATDTCDDTAVSEALVHYAPPDETLTNSTNVKPSRPDAQHQQELDTDTFIRLTNEAILRRDRRDKQRRYLQKQRDMEFSLEQETRKLRKAVGRLQEQQQRAVARMLPGATDMWGAAAEYFRLFEFGLLEQKSAQQQQQLSYNAVGLVDVASDQLIFLRSTLTADVVSDGGRGVDAMIYSWRRASFWLSDFKLEPDGLQKAGTSSVVATTITFTITERTLRNVFPSVWKDRASVLSSSVVEKLLGQSITMRGTTRFEWDPTRCRLASVVAESDLLTPLLRLLGSLQDVECVFADARISPEFRWVARS